MRNGVYTKPTATKAQVFDMIENAATNLLDAAGELALFPWTETSSAIIDEALHVAALVDELRENAEPEQPALPSNVVQFRGRTA